MMNRETTTHSYEETQSYAEAFASQLCPGDTVAFFGDLSGHPDHEKIQKFAQKHNTRLISLSDDPLEDHGGGKCIK